MVALRVGQARAAAAERWSGCGWRLNADVPGSALRRRPWRLPREVLRQAETGLSQGQLSVRGFDRVLRLAWTVADLPGHPAPDVGDVAEAMFFRLGWDESWAA